MPSLSQLIAPTRHATAYRHQATLTHAFERSGRGLHTGRRGRVRISPALPGHGIVFRRWMPDGRFNDIPARWDLQVKQPACTALGKDGVLIRTVEHLLAALSALRIDNALIETDAEELPIFDGSAVPWCQGIAGVGRIEQGEPVRCLRVLRRVSVADRHRSLSIEPAENFAVSAHIELCHLGAFDWAGPILPETFPGDIAPARSFGRFIRVMAGRCYGFVTRKPLLQGCGPRSAALLFRNRVIGGLRMPDETVRHRVLDIVGDFALIGHPIEGRIVATHTCHDLNHALIAALMHDRTAWELV
ncbi:UDP-3-O-acyl-N-acetylglucosamine deacetylase [Methylobacterium sp. NFXW15]|uniref:UDP-3-O-acyl-N-acetylglucosamine deacetylase n=1 Tax=Methylobacterium sp. NFXW15 TaxID=2819512 RepID=UPI003CFA3D32